jgi:hypothetical protein
MLKVAILSLLRKTLRNERLGQVDKGSDRVLGGAFPDQARDDLERRRQGNVNLRHGSTHVNDLERSHITGRK